ncbi:MAG: hypothetical protein WC421_00965 [Elusimicrobiales bacterium]
MKKPALILCAAVLCCGCHSLLSSQANENKLSENSARAMAHSMKGWELYSWPAGDGWKFALLPGTNRLKNAGEITAGPAVYGAEQLKAQIKTLARGEQILWNLRNMEGFSMPPQDTVSDLSDYCKDKGIDLSVLNW